MKLPRKTPRWLKITVGTLLAISSAVFILVCALLIWIVSDPARAWNVVDRHFLPEDLEISWQNIDFKSVKENWRSWQIEWLIEDLKIQKGQPEVDVRFEKLRFDFGL